MGRISRPVSTFSLLLSLLLTPAFPQARNQAHDPVVGVGFVFAPYNLPPAEQEAILGEMQHAGVAGGSMFHVLR